jgi:hypothetical protein
MNGMDMVSNTPACAHLRVQYDPLKATDGALRDRWACPDCGKEFVPRAGTPWEQVLLQRGERCDCHACTQLRLELRHPVVFYDPKSDTMLYADSAVAAERARCLAIAREHASVKNDNTAGDELYCNGYRAASERIAEEIERGTDIRADNRTDCL